MTRFGLRARAAVAALSAMLTLCAPALAEPTAADKETARSLMDEADKTVDAKDSAAALKNYLAADAIMNVPTTAIEVARTEIALGQLVEARETALRIGRMPKGKREPAAFSKARAEADAMTSDLAARIPSLEIRIEGLPPGARAHVTIDGAAVPDATLGLPRKTNPGGHVLVATAPGFAEVKQSVTLAEKQELPVVLTFGAAASPAASAGQSAAAAGPPADEHPAGGRSPLVYVGFGAGAVGIAVGAVTGVLSLSKASSAKSKCRADGSCPTTAQGDIDASKTFAVVSDVGFGVGIAGVAL
ncbi:MAG TPA: hypothetical protein VHB21_09900, partial [Minicystis sp.]|nr:hypothetical protein [Minicystis sp.]